jgi:hypothetical protein
MPVLSAVLDAIRTGAVEIIDLTTPLQESTPILRLPEPFANTINDIHTGISDNCEEDRRRRAGSAAAIFILRGGPPGPRESSFSTGWAR